MPEGRYKMLVAYDGSAYCGWQRQIESVVTVQRTIEKAVGYIVDHPVTVIGSSRTDTGVHAQGQIAVMTVNTHLDAPRLRLAINSRLPADILIRKIEPVDESFNIRSARSKRYRYLIWADRDRPIFYRHYVYHHWRHLDLPVMRQACRRYEGRHDFIAFRGRKDDRQTTVRDIFHCSIHQRGPIIIFAVEGSGFLYHMVRTMVGTVLDIGRGQGGPHRVTELLESGDRGAVGPCAPAVGLALQWIRF